MKIFMITMFILLSTILTGCMESKMTLTGPVGPEKSATSTAHAAVSNISIVNDQLILGGTALDGVSTVRITGPSSFDQTFSIESKTASNLIANGLSGISFAVGAVFNLIISDVHGAATFPVTFTLQDGAVTASKLDSMGAGVGQILKYNGTTWVPSDLGSLTFAGNWDGTANSPDLTASGSIGEYYIVNTAGSFDLLGGVGTDSWNIGDWVVWNDILTQWEKIDNASNVQSFNGRSGAVTATVGDYTWAQIDKTSSPIGDLSNVDTTGAANGSVLKFDGTDWLVGSDNLGSGTDDLGNHTATTDLAMGANNIIISGTVDGVDVSNLFASVGTNTTNISSNDTDIATNVANISTNTTNIAGKPNLGTSSGSAIDNAAVPNCLATEKLQMSAGPLFTWSCVVDSDTTIADTNTNANTICTGATFLDGDGACTAMTVDTTTTDATTIMSEAIKATLAADTTTNGQVMVWSQTNSQWEIGSAAVDTNTNAGTICTGTQILNGNGVCVAIPVDTTVADTNANTICTGATFLDGNGACTAMTVDTTVANTNAETICANGEFLNGDGTCDVGFLDADGVDDYNAAFDSEAEIDAAVANNGYGTGDLKADGTVAMTAPLDTSTFGIKLKDGDTSYVTLKANSAMAADFNFILPVDAGTNGQVLKTDGAGNLAWINASTGSVTTVTGAAPVVSSGGATPAISMAQANGTTDGYLDNLDWTTFNNKQSAITTGTTAQYLKGDLTLGTFATDVRASVLTGFSSGSGAVAATDTVLSSINKLDGNIAGKEPTLTKGNLTESTSSVLTITGGASSVIGAGATIQVAQADTTTSGYLSSGDWNTFSNKQVALTNPITGTGTSGQVAYFSGATTETSSANLTFDGTNLTVSGDIKIGNASATCNAGNEGKQRYNSTYKNMQFCDGTLWREVGNDFWADSKGCLPAENTDDEMVAVGDYCVDKYEASVWSDRSATATQYFSDSTSTTDFNYPDATNIPANFNRDGSGSNDDVYAVSKAGVIPARGVTWYQASITCANSGKELIPDHIWQLAVLGTVDPGAGTGTGGTGGGSVTDVADAQCNIGNSIAGAWIGAAGGVRPTNRAGVTSSGTNACISRFGVQDMIGNLWEWTSANGIQAGADQTAFTQGESNTAGNPFSTADTSWNLNSSAYGCDGTGSTRGTCGWKNNVAAAALRGGSWDYGTHAGAFALSLRDSGSYSVWVIGFRCARSR